MIHRCFSYVQKHPLLALLIGYCIQLLWLDKIPLIALDEPWLTSTAFNVSEGLGFENTAKGAYGGELFFLLICFLWIPLKIFGVSLYAARFVTFLIGGIAIVGFIKVLQEFEIGKKGQLLFGSFLLIGNLFFVMFHWVRAEALVCMMIIWALYFFVRAIRQNCNLDFLWSSLLVSLSCFAHPYAVSLCIVYAIAVIGVSVQKKQLMSVFYSFAGLGVTVGVAALYIGVFKSWDLYLHDVRNVVSPRVSSSISKVDFIYMNIQQFIQTYSLGYKRAFLLFTELAFLIIGMFYKPNKQVRYIAAAGTLGLIIAWVSYFFRRRYFLAFLIFVYLVMALILRDLRQSKRKQLYICALIWIGGYWSYNFAGDIYIMQKFRKAPYFRQIETQLRETIPEHAPVVSHLQFWTGLSHASFKVASIDAIKALPVGGYVVISDEFQKAVSPTTGQLGDVHHVQEGERTYYKGAMDILKIQGIQVKQILTEGYGAITVWQKTR